MTRGDRDCERLRARLEENSRTGDRESRCETETLRAHCSAVSVVRRPECSEDEE